MPHSLRMLLADARFPSSDPAHSGGVEAAFACGLVTDLPSLRSFLDGRLETLGATGAFAAAAVCARAKACPANQALWRSVEGELDARIASPAAREASRVQGGHTLRIAMTLTCAAVLDGLARATVSSDQRPHYPVAIGAVAAAAGVEPLDAGEAAAWASVAGGAYAAQRLLGLRGGAMDRLRQHLAPEVAATARRAAASSSRPLADMPSFTAPVLDYLAEIHAGLPQKQFAS